MNHFDAPEPPESAPAARLVTARHEHDWPHPRVAVGSGVWGPDDVAALRHAGITHVLDCRTTGAAHLYRDSGIDCLHRPTDDDGAPKKRSWFEVGIRYALDALRDPRARLLVHCAAGINRGPSMAFAVLRALGLSAADAEAAIRTARPRVQLRYLADAERAVHPWATR